MSSTVECLHCGALNTDDFGSCIRCGQALGDAMLAEGARRRVPAPRGRGVTVSAGAEPLFGYPAEALPAAKALFTVTLVVFGIHLSLAWRHDPSMNTLLLGGTVLDALRAGAMLAVPQLVQLEPWRLLSACFVHFGVIHIGMNMLWLLHLCRQLEPAIGSVRLIIVYVITGIASFAVSLGYYAYLGQPVPTAGASGAVFGLSGAVLGFLLRRRDERYKRWLVEVVAVSLLFGFAMPRINNAAHVGGVVAGFVLGFAVARDAPKPSTWWQKLAAALCAIAVVASLVLARLSTWPDYLAAL